MVIKIRDTRTAHEKWEQGIAEARERGYWALHKNPLPQGLLGGWDHTKQNNTASRFRDTQIAFSTRGTIPANIRDDTDDELTIVVRRLLPIDRDGLVDQTQTHIRKLSVQCIPASNLEQTGQSVSELEELEREMQSRVVGNFNEIAGPLWKEWCAWDEEYVWERFVDCGFKYRGYHQPWNSSLTDWRYRKVLEDVETLACQHGMKSWMDLMRNAHEEELRTLFQRFKNYLTTHQQAYIAPVDLPRSWAMVQHGSYYPHTWRSYLDSRTGRQYQKLPLDFNLADRAFEMELKRWTQQLYLQEQRRRTQIANSRGQLSHIRTIGNTSPTSLSPTAKSFAPTHLGSQHQTAAGHLAHPVSANLPALIEHSPHQSGEMLAHADCSLPQRTAAEYRPSTGRFTPSSLSMETCSQTPLTRHLLPFDLFDDEFQQEVATSIALDTPPSDKCNTVEPGNSLSLFFDTHFL
jgi:hypothetical protein